MHVQHRWAGSTFPEPPGILRVEVDPESGEAAVLGCGERVEEVFAAGTEPGPCSLHTSAFSRWWSKLFKRNREKPPN